MSGNCLLHVLDGGEVHARVFAHGRVRAGAGLDAEDPLLDQEPLRVRWTCLASSVVTTSLVMIRTLDAQVDQAAA